MTNKFYSFNIVYEKQQLSNWCWCACLSWISKSLNLDIEHKEQWQFQYYYNRYHLNNETIQYTKDAANKYNHPVSTHETKFTSLLKGSLNLNSISCINISEMGTNRKEFLANFFSFKNLKESFNKNRAPWIVSTAEFHMVLISGYGQDTCGEHVLVSDPYYLNREKFYNIDRYLENDGASIEKIWVLKLPESQSNHVTIEKDAYIQGIINNFNNASTNKPYLDPLKLLRINHKVNTYLRTFNNNYVSTLNNLLKNVFEEYISNDICTSYIKKNDAINLQLIHKILGDFKENDGFQFPITKFEVDFDLQQESVKFNIVSQEGKLFLKSGGSKIPWETSLTRLKLNQPKP